MKRIFFAALFLLSTLLLITEVNARGTVVLSPEVTSAVVRYVNTGSGYSYWANGSHNIGRRNGYNGINSNSTEDIWRTFYGFNLSSIPSGSTITSATLTITISLYNSGSYTASVTQTSAVNLLDLSDVWAKVGSGTGLGSGITYSATPSSLNVTSAVQSSFSAGTNFRVGVLSENEGTNLTYATTTTSLTVNYNPPAPSSYTVTIRNSFDAGSVKVDGGTYTSGTPFTWTSGSSHTIEAIDRQYIQEPANQQWYYRIYQNWEKGGVIDVTNPKSITVTSNATFTANFKKEFNTVFQNDYPGYGNGGVINVNGTQYNSPTSSFPVVQDQTITGGVVTTYQVINGIEYIFGSWSPGGSTSTSATLTPGDHTTYTANFNAKPLPPPNISVGGPVGSPIQIAWTEHPHTGVTQYQIWRIVKPKNENQGTPTLIATVNRGTSSYTDNDYVVTASYTNALLNYDVRAYFSVNGVYADPNYITVFGGNDIYKVADGGGKSSMLIELPESYSISNYPNPFNPSTTISYQLVEDATVQLKIYDVMGREVMTLVDAQKQAGYHSAQWSGKDGSGAQVSSGVYLYRFMASPSNGAKPFATSGKLVLTK